MNFSPHEKFLLENLISNIDNKNYFKFQINFVEQKRNVQRIGKFL